MAPPKKSTAPSLPIAKGTFFGNFFRRGIEVKCDLNVLHEEISNMPEGKEKKEYMGALHSLGTYIGKSWHALASSVANATVTETQA